MLQVPGFPLLEEPGIWEREGCLTWLIRVSPQPQSHPRNGEEEEESSSSPVQPAQLFAPKSLVLVSRLDHAEVFRVSLKPSGRGETRRRNLSEDLEVAGAAGGHTAPQCHVLHGTAALSALNPNVWPQSSKPGTRPRWAAGGLDPLLLMQKP